MGTVFGSSELGDGVRNFGTRAKVLRDTAIETTEQALSVAHELITYAQGFAATGVRSGLDEE